MGRNRCSSQWVGAMVVAAVCLAGCLYPAPTPEATSLPDTPMSSPTLEVPAGTPTPSSPKLESTGLGVNTGLGNIAWSHDGELIAYTYAFGVWVVPVGEWDKTEKVYTAAPPEEYILESRFVIWLPDDKAIGFTLGRPVDAWQTEESMVQLNLTDRTIAFISEEKAELIDWSKDGYLLAWRDGAWIFDMNSQTWQPLIDPETDSPVGSFPHWTNDDAIVLGRPADWQWSSGTISLVNWQLDQWEDVAIDNRPVQMTCNSAFPCRPVPSPDGTQLAWIETRATSDGYSWQIVEYSKGRSETTVIANGSDYGFERAQALTWSPDSRSLAFSALGESGKDRTIWILDLFPTK